MEPGFGGSGEEGGGGKGALTDPTTASVKICSENIIFLTHPHPNQLSGFILLFMVDRAFGSTGDLVILVKTNKKDPVKIEKMVYQIEIEQNCANKIELPEEGINVFSNKK